MKSTNDQLCFDDHDIEIINKSDRDILFDIISDIEYIRAFNLNIKEYLLFRDELMKDVEKNKSVFQKVKVNL